MDDDDGIQQKITGTDNTQIHSGNDTIAAIGDGALAAGRDINLIRISNPVVCVNCNSISSTSISCKICKDYFACNICWNEDVERKDSLIRNRGSIFFLTESVVKKINKDLYRTCKKCDLNYLEANFLSTLAQANEAVDYIRRLQDIFVEQEYDTAAIIGDYSEQFYDDIFYDNFDTINLHYDDIWNTITKLEPRIGGYPEGFLEKYIAWIRNLDQSMKESFKQYEFLMQYWKNDKKDYIKSYLKYDAYFKGAMAWCAHKRTDFLMGSYIKRRWIYGNSSKEYSIFPGGWSDGRGFYIQKENMSLHPMYPYHEVIDILLGEGWKFEHEFEAKEGLIFMVFKKQES